MEINQDFEDSVGRTQLLSENTSLIDCFPYASRLASNDVPSCDEIEDIKAFLVDPTEQVQQMEAEMASLQARLQILRRRHAALKKQVEACRSLITIPRRLPDDILHEIFLHCLPETSCPTMDGSAVPSLLTAVCRRWRTLAIQTPTLWSGISMLIDDVKKNRSMSLKQLETAREASQQRLCSTLSLWLTRSEMCPLTIAFRLSVKDNRLNKLYVQTTYKKCLKILLSSVSRWKDVAFGGNVETMSALLKMPATEFHSLESLYLNLHGDHLPSVVPMFHAPCLRKVAIQYTPVNPTTLSLPWPRLTHLDLGGPTGYPSAPNIYHLSTVLVQSASLIYLGLDISESSDIMPMDLPNLQRISIRQHTASQDSNAPRLLSENLKAPSLRQISLRDFDDASFPAILSRHGRSITSLDFNTHYMQFQTFADSLSHCPSLESLSIIRLHGDNNHFKINNKFFSLLIPSDSNNQSPLCPLLRHFVFEDIPCDTLSGVVSFLESRQISLPLGPSRPIKISTSFVREGDEGGLISEEMVQQVLKPFTDNNTLFKLCQVGPNRSYYAMGSERFSESGYGGHLQFADCWRD